MSKLTALRDLTVIGGIAAAVGAIAVEVFDLDLPRARRYTATPGPVAPDPPHGWLRSGASGHVQRPATAEEAKASAAARERNGGSGLFARVGYGDDAALVFEDEPRYAAATTVHFVTDDD